MPELPGPFLALVPRSEPSVRVGSDPSVRVRVTSGAEIGGLDLPPDFTRIRRVLGKARRTVKGLDGAVTREWMGYRPSTPDSKPIIDRSPNFPNVFFTFGHGHSGLTQSAATGLLLSDLVAGRDPRIDLHPFSATRF